MVNSTIAGGSFLVVSLLLSILALGITDVNRAFSLCWAAIYLFFGGIVMMLVMLCFLGRTS